MVKIVAPFSGRGAKRAISTAENDRSHGALRQVGPVGVAATAGCHYYCVVAPNNQASVSHLDGSGSEWMFGVFCISLACLVNSSHHLVV